MGERVSFVTPREVKRSLDELQRVTGEDRSTLLRMLIGRCLAETKMDIAVERFVKVEAPLEGAASTAGVSLWGFLDEPRCMKVALRRSAAEAEAEMRRVLARRKREASAGQARRPGLWDPEPPTHR